MRFSELLKSCFTTLRMNGRRTFLTMIGIIIGVGAVITIMSLGNGMTEAAVKELTQNEEGKLSQTIHFSPSDYEADWSKMRPFSANDQLAIEGMEGVAGLSQEINLDDPYQDYIYTNLSYQGQDMSYQGSIAEMDEVEMLAGRQLESFDSEGQKRHTAISFLVASELFSSPEEALGKIIMIDETPYLIVGVFDSFLPASEEGMLMGNFDEPVDYYLPKSVYQRINQVSGDNLSLTLLFEEGANTKLTSQKVVDYLNEEGSMKDQGQYEFYDMSEMLQSIQRTFQTITIFVSAIAAISLVIAGVGVMNMMYISVSERTNEIGIRRSLGATQKNIALQFLLEGVAITSVGGVIGYIFGILLAQLISAFPQIPFDASVDLATALVAMLISVVIGIVFSVFPARSAAQKNVVEILR